MVGSPRRKVRGSREEVGAGGASRSAPRRYSGQLTPPLEVRGPLMLRFARELCRRTVVVVGLLGLLLLAGCRKADVSVENPGPVPILEDDGPEVSNERLLPGD